MECWDRWALGHVRYRSRCEPLLVLVGWVGEAGCWGCGEFLGVPGLRPPLVPPRLVDLGCSSFSLITSPPIAVTFLVLPLLSFPSFGVGPVSRSSSPSYSSSSSSSSTTSSSSSSFTSSSSTSPSSSLSSSSPSWFLVTLSLVRVVLLVPVVREVSVFPSGFFPLLLCLS